MKDSTLPPFPCSKIIEQVAARNQIFFTAPNRTWSTNDERKMHHMVRAGLVKSWANNTTVHWWQQTNRAKNVGPSLVRVTIPFRDQRRRDPANYCGTVGKAIIDGLVTAGAWPDDNPQYVTHLEPRLTTDSTMTVIVDIIPRPQNWDNLFI